MKVTIYTHPEFECKFKQYKKKYHSLVSDYRAFLDSIKENPFQGRSLGQGLRKVRFGVAAFYIFMIKVRWEMLQISSFPICLARNSTTSILHLTSYIIHLPSALLHHPSSLMSSISDSIQAKCLAFGDRIIKLNDYLLEQASQKYDAGRQKYGMRKGKSSFSHQTSDLSQTQPSAITSSRTPSIGGGFSQPTIEVGNEYRRQQC